MHTSIVLIYRPRRNGRTSWPWVAGWLHIEINVRHQELNAVTHLIINRAVRARCRLSLLIEANALTTTPDHHPVTTCVFIANRTCNTTVTGSCCIRYSRIRHDTVIFPVIGGPSVLSAANQNA